MNRKQREAKLYWKSVAEAEKKFGFNTIRHQDHDPEILSHRRIINYRSEVHTHPYEDSVKSFVMSENMWSLKHAQFCIWNDAYFVDDPYKLHSIIPQLRASSVLAVDMESSNRLSYGDMASTIQISTVSTDFIIDAIKIPFEIRNTLKPILEDGKKLLLMHDGRQDVTWLKNQFQIYPVAVFDTAVFHQVMTGGPLPSFDLVKEKYLGTQGSSTMPKKVFQCADWTNRPLHPDLLQYSQNDSHYLIRAAANIFLDEDSGKILQAIKDFEPELLKSFGPNIVGSPSEDLKKLKSVVDLYDPRDMDRYEHLWQYRDLLGKYYDRSPHDILTTRMLVNLAKCKNPVTSKYEEIIYRSGNTPKVPFFPSQGYKILEEIFASPAKTLQKLKETMCHSCTQLGHPGWACWIEHSVWDDKKKFFNKSENRRFKTSENLRHDKAKQRRRSFLKSGSHAQDEEVWDIPNPQMLSSIAPPLPFVFEDDQNNSDSDSSETSTIMNWYSAESVISSASSAGYETAQEY